MTSNKSEIASASERCGSKKSTFRSMKTIAKAKPTMEPKEKKKFNDATWRESILNGSLLARTQSYRYEVFKELKKELKEILNKHTLNDVGYLDDYFGELLDGKDHWDKDPEYLKHLDKLKELHRERLKLLNEFLSGEHAFLTMHFRKQAEELGTGHVEDPPYEDLSSFSDSRLIEEREK